MVSALEYIREFGYRTFVAMGCSDKIDNPVAGGFTFKALVSWYIEHFKLTTGLGTVHEMLGWLRYADQEFRAALRIIGFELRGSNSFYHASPSTANIRHHL